jgi:prophage regulatory protein
MMKNNTTLCTNQTRFLRIAEVLNRVCLGKTTLYARVRLGQFPAPIKLSNTISVWIEDEVTAWMNDQLRMATG